MAAAKSGLDSLVIPPRGPVTQRKSGAGTHGDRRLKRLRDRGQARRADVAQRLDDRRHG